jgi:sulfur-carrier protein
MSRTVCIDLCGRLADEVGPSLTLPLAAPASISALCQQLSVAYPALADALATLPIKAALDEVLVDSQTIVKPGQRLALFPPVSGG